MKFTVNDLLNINSLTGIRLVGGVNQRDREISDVNMWDNPETLRWLKKGDLLLTTGYAFKDEEDLQERLIKEMATLNCSGLAIKVKRYFDYIPKTMIDLADEYLLPIIEIPFEYSLSYVSSMVYKEIMSGQAKMLKNRKRSTIDLPI